MQHHSDIHQSKFVKEAKNFAIGGLSGIIASISTLPIDYVKVQIQCMSGGKTGVKPNPLAFAREVLRTKGFTEFYSGLTSAISRQLLYATTRLGLYKTLVDREKALTGSAAITFWKKFVYSSISGGIGAFFANPCDIALIRLQTDHSLPVEKRRNYKGIFDALYRIPREDGVLA